MSRVLLISILVFLAVASSVLVWEGLAMGMGRASAPAGRDLWRVRLRFAVGVIVFALVLWIAFGLVTRAW